ncbi:hypothetical protein JZU46_03990 [bacterium]|nr:hypothetical protein [bacterium]
MKIKIRWCVCCFLFSVLTASVTVFASPITVDYMGRGVHNEGMDVDCYPSCDPYNLTYAKWNESVISNSTHDWFGAYLSGTNVSWVGQSSDVNISNHSLYLTFDGGLFGASMIAPELFMGQGSVKSWLTMGFTLELPTVFQLEYYSIQPGASEVYGQNHLIRDNLISAAGPWPLGCAM